MTPLVDEFVFSSLLGDLAGTTHHPDEVCYLFGCYLEKVTVGVISSFFRASAR